MSADMQALMPLAPIDTSPLFRPLHAELLSLLQTLNEDEWRRQTLAREWSVRDVAAHLLDGDLRRISAQRDRHAPPPAVSIDSYGSLVEYLNTLNREWVVASRRVSTRLIISLLEQSGAEFCDLVENLDPAAPALYPVAWAGEETSRMWMDLGREYTEKWHHQQQIRVAVGAPLLLEPEWATPLFDISVRVLPHALRETPASFGTSVVVVINGFGAWSVIAGQGGWQLFAGEQADADVAIRMSPDVAWRLFYNALDPAARDRLDISGDLGLAAPILAARSVMV